MKLNKVAIFMVAVILLGVNLFVFSQQIMENKKEDAQKGLVTFTDGRVKKREGQNTDWMNAQKNMPVNSGDHMRTYQQSRAELELLELDVIRMAPETTIDIVKLYEETKGKVKETKINLQEGDIWAKLSQKDATVKFDISTPIAGAAITGTTLRMNVQEDSTTELKVYTGEVKISNVPEKTDLKPQQFGKPQEVPGPHEVPGPREVTMEEWVYIVKNMQKIVIGGDGTVKSFGDFSPTDKDEQTDWVKWNLKRDKLER